ncbi:MAG TPA: hypothetical protein VIM65_10575, partial [Cyclobacteriaceae bacterium]
MATADQSNQDKSRAKRYFIFAYAFLLVLALSWSIDGAFVYLFLGAACFFIYLGIRDYKPAVTNDHYREASNQRQQRRQEYQKQSSSTIKPSGTKISLP